MLLSLTVQRDLIQMLCLAWARMLIGLAIKLLMLQVAPEALDKHIAGSAPLAVFAYLDAMGFEGSRQILAGKLTTLAIVKDFR
jgi:hypothetical protein